MAGDVMQTTRHIVVCWVWGPGSKHAGTRFCAVHGTDIDGRILDWPSIGLIPLGASEVTITQGEGLDLLRSVAARTRDQRARDADHPSDSAAIDAHYVQSAEQRS